jgi:hypothetical protein
VSSAPLRTPKMLPPQRTVEPMNRSGAARTSSAETVCGVGERKASGGSVAQPPSRQAPAAMIRAQEERLICVRLGSLPKEKPAASRPRRSLEDLLMEPRP